MSMSSQTERWLLETVYGNRQDICSRLGRALLMLLSYVYRAAIFLYLLPFRIGVRKKKRLPCPVISVGNLTVGGTGKTPAVRLVCDELIRMGYNPAVLSYGYGGRLGGRFGVVSDGKQIFLSALEVGDEPVMLAKQMPGVAVLVGKDRCMTGTVAIRDYGADIIVLDDGLQVWKLDRDLDIVLVDVDSPFDNGRCLPAGRLRQPPSVLKEAGCIVITGGLFQRREQDYQPAVTKIRRVASDAPLFFSGYQTTVITTLGDGTVLSEQDLRDKRVFVVSSIARPERFEHTVERIGAIIVGKRFFRDHHLYEPSDIQKACAEATEAGAQYIVTTEKDQVKINPEIATMPILVICVRMFLGDETAFRGILEEKVRAASLKTT